MLGLVPLRLEAWGPFLFVCADPEAPSPARDACAARLPFDPATLVFRERVDYALEANWKIAVENYLECYHCPVAHPGFSEPRRRRSGLRTSSTATGRVWSQYGQARDGERASAPSTSSGRG